MTNAMFSKLLWDRKTGEVSGESVLFTESGEALTAFPAAKIRRVYNPTLGCDYAEGTDYLATPGTRTIRRTAKSAMPFLPKEIRYPAKDKAVLFPDPAANAIGTSAVSPTGLVRFDGRDFFAKHQVLIDYVTEARLPELPATDAGCLPNTKKLLREGKTLDIAFIGDSITDGWNASAKVGCAPGQPAWPGLVTEFLNTIGSCRMFNGAVSGSGSASAVEHLDACRREFTPALLFIAYGMNDMSSLSQEEFGRNIRAVMDAGLKRNPAMEFILVSQMAGNAEWDHTPAGKDLVFARELETIAAECKHRAFAPVNPLWRALTDGCGKSFLNVTGNGVNHPNDYGHRIYAFAVSGLFA